MVTIDTIAAEVPPKQASAAAGVALSVRGMGEWLKRRWRRRTTRVHLSELTEQQLRDVGLSPEMAAREIRKSRLLLIERPYQPPF